MTSDDMYGYELEFKRLLTWQTVRWGAGLPGKLVFQTFLTAGPCLACGGGKTEEYSLARAINPATLAEYSERWSALEDAQEILRKEYSGSSGAK